MVTQIMSRTERRMEKKQALLLLVLVLAVALASFALGVMVGRAGGRSSAENPPPPERLPVAQAPVSGGASTSTAPAADHLTFYDALPKGEQPPLGSGINLPPEDAVSKTPPAAEKAAAATVAKTPPPAGSSVTTRQVSDGKAVSSAGGVIQAPNPSMKPAALPKAQKAVESPPPAAEKPVSAATRGTFVIQVASYPDEGGARKLRDRLAGRGFGAFIEQADLGSKGKWHRVIVGPYESDQSAAAAASRIKATEKVSGIVRRK